jgi:DNA-binding transcriptional LysR family regulator
VRRDGTLTSAGEFVANHVLRAESLLVQATLGAAEIRKSGSGSLAIVASWLTGTYLLPDIMAESSILIRECTSLWNWERPSRPLNAYVRIVPS